MGFGPPGLSFGNQYHIERSNIRGGGGGSTMAPAAGEAMGRGGWLVGRRQASGQASRQQCSTIMAYIEQGGLYGS